MEPFDLILLVVIGDLVQQGVTQSDYSLTGATTVIVTMAVLVVFTAWVSFRFARVRPVLEGHPTLLIADGEILMRNVRRQRMTVEEDGRRPERRRQMGHAGVPADDAPGARHGLGQASQVGPPGEDGDARAVTARPSGHAFGERALVRAAGQDHAPAGVRLGPGHG